MKLKWTGKALADLERLHDFLAVVNPPAAARAVQSLAKAPTRLLANPRIGEQLFEFEGREVRRIIVGKYEILGPASDCPYITTNFIFFFQKFHFYSTLRNASRRASNIMTSTQNVFWNLINSKIKLFIKILLKLQTFSPLFFLYRGKLTSDKASVLNV